ncbi:N-6 DNA methylase [Nocardia sp. NPDC051981]|uniref:N-6 DNA methylase n=1 Tax=Nocardia sp. NPDC051981 TaxID=3155417 RepID=UPI00341DB5D7
MPKPVSTVSAAEISRLAGVTRATVSNWRRRHADFPKSIAGTEARPEFDLHEVQQWLADHRLGSETSAVNELRAFARARTTPDAAMRVLEALSPTGAGWAAPDLTEDFADEAVDIFERAADTEGARTAIDILGERALEDTTATGLYVTPPRVAELLAALANSPGTGAAHVVLDPACGSGSVLLAAAQAGASELYGQDALPVQVQRTRLLLEAEASARLVVRAGDSLTADAFPDLRADAVLCNPPYGQRDWGSTELAFDPRWDYGLPPRAESELAWVQHALAHLRPEGTAVLLLPPAVATRGSGRKIRANLVRTGALRAVIGLAPGAAQPWHVGLQIWILRRPQPGAPVPDSVLFIDTTGLPSSTDGEDRALGDAVLKAWRAFDGPRPEDATESGLAVPVRLVDVLTEEVDLTPARYMRSSLDADTVSDEVEEAIRRLDSAASELSSVTGDLGGWSASPGKSWRYMTIADLSNHGQLEWIRSEPPSAEPAVLDDQRRILTAPDIATGVPASGTAASSAPATNIDVEIGDVLIPTVRSDRTGGRSARVATAEDAGSIRGPHIHTLRVDPDRLDPWFLAGFLTGAENVSATRTSTVRFDPSRLRIPVLGLAEQQRYGEMFRLLFLLRTAARRATYATENVAELVTTGLTAGALLPERAEDRQ